jgi:hypothetical protein
MIPTARDGRFPTLWEKFYFRGQTAVPYPATRPFKERTMAFLKSALAAALLSLSAQASLLDAHRWGFGPVAGINVAGADLGGPEDRTIPGWAFGGRVEMDMNRMLTLSTDPMFIRHGVEFSPSGQSGDGRAQFYLVEVPLFLKARASLFNLGVYAFAGPSASFLWDASGRMAEGRNLNGEAAWGDWSGDIGFGSAFAVAPLVEVTADARYSHGFTDLLENGVGEVDYWRSRDVRLVLGVMLHGG